MDERTQSLLPPLELNPALDTNALAASFRRRFALHIENFLSPTSAVTLYETVAHDLVWRSFLVSNERLFAAPCPHGPQLSELSDGLFDRAYEGASAGFAYLYDRNSLFAEDQPAGTCMDDVVEPPLWSQVNDFANSKEFLEFMRGVTGVQKITRAAIRATRFRSGHFEMFHAATFSADKTRTRVAAFSINLTPEWKPEWGGLLEFRHGDAGIVEAFVPTFNSIDVMGFPVGHWVSCVAPFASTARLAISGRLYVEPQA